MPTPTETLRDLGRLNRWFALSTVALLASLLWAIWEDYDRPWRWFQNDYMVAQAALAHLDYLNTQTETYQEKTEAARRQLEEAHASAAERAEQRTGLETALTEENAKFDAINIDFGNTEAILMSMPPQAIWP